jgi:hypothetical protein
MKVAVSLQDLERETGLADPARPVRVTRRCGPVTRLITTA